MPTERKTKSSTPLRAAPALADCGEVDVVLENDRQVEPLAQLVGERQTVQPWHVLGEADDAVRALDDPGHSRQDGVDQAPLEPRLLDKAGAELLDRPERCGSAALGELDVLPGTNAAAEVADRPAQEAGAEVEAEHERSLGDGLEVHGAVGTGPRALRKPHARPVLDKRLERQRHRGLRDPRTARDLGPRDWRSGPDRLEHRALVQVLEKGRMARVCSLTMVNNPNQACGKRPGA